MSLTFVNFKQTVTTATTFRKTKIRRVSFAGDISYFIFNKCFCYKAIVQLLTSPDRKVWMNDGLEIEVKPRELIILVPNYFSKYLTVAYKSAKPCHSTELDIWFQMTRPPARKCFGVGNDPS
ncbi:MAG: DUF6385 domain-containing protein [Thermincola sp.]|nr:DUF6385 domain-containing protein [Thermincola sp.]MDT3704039.1 DUF6385 domain-containing protein [Thermincola sp.]